MTIGILYESKEWSDFALRDHIASMGAPVKLIDMQEDISTEELLSCSLVISRIFASSVFRGHGKALDQMPTVIELLEKNRIPMINPAEAHYYEISKTRTKEVLEMQGFSVPKLYGSFYPAQIKENAEIPDLPGIEYPCVVKPDCGGRTSHTFIAHDREELREGMTDVPDVMYIAEEYIRPDKGYVTRLEIIGGECVLAVKRSVTANGLSAYHLGSVYEFYPDLPHAIGETAIKAMELLHIEAGSMDIIENDTDIINNETGSYIIDVNSVSNVSEDNTEMFKLDLMKETAAYAVARYSL